PEDENPYNRKTRALLAWFCAQGIGENQGNVVFPEGNAKKYLAEYFPEETLRNPYWEDPNDVRCVSFEPDGGVLGQNLFRKDIMDILRDYRP
ncbi:MAG: hypothetical protein IKD07_01285, partial [Clostridia bacterium]|nr:hypothetical protein [Clostridia bacterium]